MKNKILEQQTEHNCNLAIQLANHSLGNFVQVDKEFLYTTNKKTQAPISLENRGLFITLLSFQGLDWNLNYNGLATICGCSTNKIQRNMKDLQELGYLEIHKERNCRGHFTGYKYKLFETLDPSKWQDGISYGSYKNPKMKSSETENSNLKDGGQYNNISIKDNNKLKNINISNPKVESNKESSIISSSKEKALKSLENTNKSTSSKSSYTSRTSLNKNKKVEYLKKKFFKQIEETEADKELQELLVKFFTIYIEQRGKLHEITFIEMMNELNDLSSNDLEVKRKIVKRAIKQGWLGFYPLGNSAQKYKTPQPQPVKSNETDIQDSTFAYDEDGNTISF